MASSQAPTSVTMMTAAFPPMVEAINGEPNLQDLIRFSEIQYELGKIYTISS